MLGWCWICPGNGRTPGSRDMSSCCSRAPHAPCMQTVQQWLTDLYIMTDSSYDNNDQNQQCVTVAQLCTGPTLLLAAYLHHIGHQDSTTCPHRQDENKILLHQTRLSSGDNYTYKTSPLRWRQSSPQWLQCVWNEIADNTGNVIKEWQMLNRYINDEWQQSRTI